MRRVNGPVTPEDHLNRRTDMHGIAFSLVIGWPLVAVLVLFPRPVDAQPQPTLLELRSGSPASDRLRVDSAGGLVALGALERGAIPTEGGGVRMMWYPGKAAFRAGRVLGTNWDDVNIGNYSSATGHNTTASGISSTAMGLSTTASGISSTAMGVNTTASGNYSTAMGYHASTAGFSGAFVYGDNSTTTVLNATAAHQFSVRAAGGIRLFTNSALTSGLILSSGGGLVAPGTYGAGAIPAEGAGVRMLWYPGKAAFRVGRVTGTQWDNATVGVYSLATGYSTTASGGASTAMGSGTTASGGQSTAMGSGTTASGDNSTAIGSNASTAGYLGAFVYGDAYTLAERLNATAAHQFSVRASGGIRLFTNSVLTAGVLLAPGGSSWNTVSDRARKHDFGVVDGEDLLARIRGIPVMSWRYMAEEDATVRHIGPMAQDWDAALPELGGTGLTINMSDLDGVSLAAIQALEARSTAQAEQIAAQKEQITAQKEQIAAQREEIAAQREAIAAQRGEIAARRDVVADLLARVQRLESRPDRRREP
jgi:hypothetical protein